MASEKIEFDLLDIAKRNAAIWKNSHDCLFKKFSVDDLNYGSSFQAVFELHEIINSLNVFITDAENNSFFDDAPVKSYLHFLTGTLEAHLADLYARNHQPGRESEKRACQAISNAIDHYTKCLNLGAMVSPVSKPGTLRKYGRHICFLALANAYSETLTFAGIFDQVPHDGIFSQDLSQRFDYYRDQALADVSMAPESTDQTKVRLRIMALGLVNPRHRDGQTSLQRSEMYDLCEKANHADKIFLRQLAEPNVVAHRLLLWKLAFSLYQEEVEQKYRTLANTQGGGYYFIMPDVMPSGETVFSHWNRTLQKNWKSQSARFDENWLQFLLNTWVYKNLTVQAEIFQSEKLKLYTLLLEMFYYQECGAERYYQDTYELVDVIHSVQASVSCSNFTDQERLIFHVNLVALEGETLCDRIEALPGTGFDHQGRILSESDKKSMAKSTLKKAHRLIKSVSKDDLKSLPLSHRWRFHLTAAKVYGMMPQNPIIKRTRLMHQRLATRGQHIVPPVPTQNLIIDGFLKFLTDRE